MAGCVEEMKEQKKAKYAGNPVRGDETKFCLAKNICSKDAETQWIIPCLPPASCPQPLR